MSLRLSALSLFFLFLPITYLYAQTQCNICDTALSLNNGLVACYPFNGNANDESGNNNHGTVNGATLTTDRFGNANSAYYFNGSSYISAANSTSLSSPTTSITMSFWVSVSGWNPQFGVNYASVLSKSNSTSSCQYRTSLKDNGISIINNGLYWDYSISSSTSLNQWYFFTIVADGNTVYYYVNGSNVGQSSTHSSFSLSSTNPLYIGRDDPGTIDYFYGKIDDIRIYNRALSASEILDIYNLSSNTFSVNTGSDRNLCQGDSVRLNASAIGGTSYSWSPSTSLSNANIANPYTKPTTTTQYIVTASNGSCSAKDTLLITVAQCNACNSCSSTLSLNNGLVACYPFSGNANDESGNNNHGTVNGATLTTDRFGNTNSAYLFDGTTSEITIPSVSQLQPSTAITLCAWVFLTSTQTWATVIQQRYSNSSDPYVSYGIGANTYPSSKWQGSISNGTSGTLTNAVSPNSCPLNQWVFLACTYDNNSVALYENGILVSSVSKTGNIGYSSSYPLRIGNAVNGQYLTGKIDDVRIYNRALSACEIYTLYNNCSNSFTVNAGNDTSVCQSDSVQINATTPGAISYIWSPSTGLSNPNIANPYAKPTTTTQYIVTASNGSCSAKDTIQVSVTNIEANITTQDTSICLGDSVKLKTQINGTSFTWSPVTYLDNPLLPEPTSTPNTTTKYILTATKGTCVRQDSVTVTLTTLAQTNAGSDQTICKDDSAQLQASPGASFVWKPSSGLNDSTIYNPKASPSNTTSYIVKASTGSCYAFDTVLVTVIDKPIVNAGPDLFTCQNDSIAILAIATGANAYQWSPSSYLSDTTILQPKAKLTGNTKFILKATNTATSCFNFDTLIINISKPFAAFTADPMQGSLPLNVHFTNLSSGRIASYLWDFGDTSAYSSIKNPSHTFNSENVYYTLLTVTDSSGCIDTAGISIHVLNELMVFIPNVFTPNGDGVNEEFEVGYTKGLIKNMKGSIWNRWGSQVYEFEMPGGKWWNGKVDGVYASDASYVYIIEITTLKGQILKFHGTVTLLR